MDGNLKYILKSDAHWLSLGVQWMGREPETCRRSNYLNHSLVTRDVQPFKLKMSLKARFQQML